MLAGSIVVELILFATLLMALHRSLEDFPKEQQARFQAEESIPDKPADPFTFNAVDLMRLLLISSYMIWWMFAAGVLVVMEP